ncbi:methyl-accepting chemotaxis protein [Zoogloeaceae bacterium G21618-S1]|nr:methyl-accepting chemotaxis protein [Zoogloeaceae bacterium G21618-S1]
MKSLQTKLIVLFIALVLAISAALSIAAYLELRKGLLAGVADEARAVALGNSARIAEWIDTRGDIVSAMVPVALADDPLPFFQRAAEGGGFDIVYAGYADKHTVFSTPQNLPASYDPTARPWYSGAVAAGKRILTAPYADASSGELVVTFATPVKGSSGVDAVVAGDISIAALVKSVLSIQLNGGYAMLVDRQGTIIAHKDKALTLKPMADFSPELAALSSQLGSASTNQIDASVGGTASLVSWQPVAGTEWTLLLVQDRAVVLSPLNALLMTLAGIVVVCAGGFVALAVVVLRRLLRGLGSIHNAMEQIAGGGGDLTRQIPVHGDDEVARTARAFNQFQAGLRTMFQSLRQDAAVLAEGVQQLEANVQRMASRSEALADTTTANAASIEEITVSVSHIADNSADAESLARSTGKLTDSAAEEVAHIATQAGASATRVRELADVLSGLERRSEDINGIVSVIREIADQTNLLALNAAIEAARAGEQGRGFAVVADEVRKLAERTGKATVEISDMLGGMRQETGQAVGFMTETVGTVESSVSLTEDARVKIREIGEQSRNVAERMAEIALSINEQRSATSVMAQSTEDITTRVQETDAALQDARGTVRSLADVARRTQDQFARFTL